MRYGNRTPFRSWRHKTLAVLVLIALAPLLVAVAVRAVTELANAVVVALGPVVPYAVVIVALTLVYRLMFGQRP